MRVLLALIMLCLSSPALGAIAEVASMRASGSYTNVASIAALAFPNNVTAGHLLIVAGDNWNASDQTMAVTGCSTTWAVIQAAGTSGAGGVYRSFIAYGIAGASGACTPTIDPSGTGNYGSYSLDSFSGVDTTTPLDVDGGSSTSTGTSASDSITTGTANALIIGVLQHRDGTTSRTLTPGGSYTQIGEVESVSDAPHNAVFRLATTATSYTVDWTIGASVIWEAQTVSFKEAATSGICSRLRLGVGC